MTLGNIFCFKCRGNLLRCRCYWGPAGPASWMSEYKNIISSVQRRGTMRFYFEGQPYAIDFQRNFVIVKQYDRLKGEIEKRATKPHTTVIILKLDPKEKGLKNSEVVYTATVGCYYKDTYTPEAGRLFALKEMCRKYNKKALPTELREVIWDTYLNRNKKSETPKPPTPATPAISPNIIEAQLVS